jgi:glutamyl-tRNA reductase
MTDRSAVDGTAPCAYVVVGANHRSSSPGLRDRIFVSEAQAPGLLSALAAAGVAQCLVMSTCDRVEVQAVAPDPVVAGSAIRAALAARGVPADTAGDPFYVLTGDAAVRHVFAVAASLDSEVIGESQVLGQLHEAHRAAAAAGTMGSELEALLQAAYGAAKAVRSETAIAEGPVSMASAAVRVARDLHGDIADTRGLLIGGGDMGMLMLEQFRHAGMREPTVAASSPALAESLARAAGGHAASLDDLETLLEAADIVVTAAGLGRHLVTAETMRRVLRRRRHKPVFVIDASVPGDVEPAVDRLADAFRYDLDDLEAFATRNRDAREEAAEEARAIVASHAAAFERNRAGRQAVPTVTDLRARFEAIRAAVLAADPGGEADALTRRLVARLLHDPSEVLRDSAGAGDEMTRAARALFRLDAADAGDGSAAAAGGAGKESDEDEPR